MIDSKAKVTVATIYGIVWFLTLLVTCIMLFGCAQPQNGSTGLQGAPGVAGPKGDQGSVGNTGPSGRDGLNGTTITMVQLCPGTSHYPSVFIEVAFCVDNSLYATYSANGGFSTMLPPGAYSSNAIGSSCNFTVVSGCEIQY